LALPVAKAFALPVLLAAARAGETMSVSADHSHATLAPHSRRFGQCRAVARMIISPIGQKAQWSAERTESGGSVYIAIR
jgi:hypothetical protein